MDYSKLEKEIQFIDPEYPKVKAKVIGCDPDIGITIVDPSIDPGHEDYYLLCLPGPSSPEDFPEELYKQYFDASVRMLETGIYTTFVIDKIFNDFTGHNSDGTMPSCPFGQ